MEKLEIIEVEAVEVVNIDPTQFGLTKQQGNEIASGLPEILKERDVLIVEFNKIIDLEPIKENISMFKELRQKFVKNRTQHIDKWHKNGKEVSLRVGQLYDAIKKRECTINEQKEELLLLKEKHFENIEKQKKEALKIERQNKCLVYTTPEMLPAGIGEMDMQTFDTYLTGLIAAYNQRIEAERLAKEEAERIEKIKVLHDERKESILNLWNFLNQDQKDLNFGALDENSWVNLKFTLEQKAEAHKKEQEKIKAENERLAMEQAELKAKAEAEAKKQAEILAKQKAEADAKLKAEREAKAKLEAELKAKQEAEQAEKDRIEKEKKEAEKAAKKAAAAPDKDKLIAMITNLNLPLVDLKSVEAYGIYTELLNKFEGFKVWAKSEIEKI